MKTKDQAQALYEKVGKGEILEAFEEYYADDVVMQELGQEPRKGKAANREYEKQFVGNIQEMHGGGVNAITSDETNNISMVESWMDVTFKDGNRVKMEQVAVQKWENGKIVHEKFYHN